MVYICPLTKFMLLVILYLVQGTGYRAVKEFFLPLCLGEKYFKIKICVSSTRTDQEKGQTRLFRSHEIERKAGKWVLHTTEQLCEAS